MSSKTFATDFQKENFKIKFEAIVQKNINLHNQFKIQFFDTTRTNYVINGLDGKSINVTASMSDNELELYRTLKSSWQKLKL